MLHLRSATDPAWLEVALASLDQVLVDHAHCEHKAAATALAFVSKYPDDPHLVVTLSALARDEAAHFAKMVQVCVDRGLFLGHPEKDPYVDALLGAARKTNLESRVDRLLVCALIEGRSCERLKLLAQGLVDRGFDDALCALYRELWMEEAHHHTLFIELAERTLSRAGKKDAERLVQERLVQLAEHEAQVLARLPLRPAIH